MSYKIWDISSSELLFHLLEDEAVWKVSEEGRKCGSSSSQGCWSLSLLLYLFSLNIWQSEQGGHHLDLLSVRMSIAGPDSFVMAVSLSFDFYPNVVCQCSVQLLMELPTVVHILCIQHCSSFLPVSCYFFWIHYTLQSLNSCPWVSSHQGSVMLVKSYFLPALTVNTHLKTETSPSCCAFPSIDGYL